MGDTTAAIDVDTTSQWYLEDLIPGGCVDTSNAFWVIVDSSFTVVINQPWLGQPLPTTTLCLTDSTLLTATDTVLYDLILVADRLSFGKCKLANLVNDTPLG